MTFFLVRIENILEQLSKELKSQTFTASTIRSQETEDVVAQPITLTRKLLTAQHTE